MEIDGIVLEIFDELKRARGKFPQWPNDPIHGAAILCEEAAETLIACLQATYADKQLSDARAEAIQTAAMAIRWVQNYDRMFSAGSNGQHPDSP